MYKISQNVSLLGNQWNWKLYDTKNKVQIKPYGIDVFYGWSDVPLKELFSIQQTGNSSMKEFTYSELESLVK